MLSEQPSPSALVIGAETDLRLAPHGSSCCASHGDPDSQLAYFFRDWERVFTVVQWDQRGAGRTYGRYGNATPNMTLYRFIEDGAEVADYARRRLHQPRSAALLSATELTGRARQCETE